MSLFQISAELGVVGAILFAALVGIVLAISTKATPPVALIFSGAAAALIVHSFADHILEFWPVTLVFGISLGLLTAAGHGRIAPSLDPHPAGASTPS